MHERNIYKYKKPDFGELAKEYPSLAKYVTSSTQGRSYIDFKQPEALRELTYTLLKKDFSLDVEIPLNHLIPTVPLRLNYIHWIEDLLATLNTHPSVVHGIDIGCGASCIYPLLGTKINSWNFVATDVDEENLKYAKKNVEKNGLQSCIKVLKGKKDCLLQSVFKDVIKESQTSFDFCMCNPPFFGDKLEASGLQSRTGKRPLPKTASTASENESITEGGEVHFVLCLIEESLHLRENISWYTSMLGKKESLKVLRKYLREREIPVVTTTEFFQGKTMRWGIGWSFLSELNTKMVSKKKPKRKKQKPFLLGVKKTELIADMEENILEEQNVYKTSDPTVHLLNKVEKILKELEIDVMNSESETTRNRQAFVLTAKAVKNTWIHKRKRRRMEDKIHEKEKEAKEVSVNATKMNCELSSTTESEREIIKTCNSINSTFEIYPQDSNTCLETTSLSDQEKLHEGASLLKSEAATKMGYKSDTPTLCGSKRKSDNSFDALLDTPILFCLTIANGEYFHLDDHQNVIVQFDEIEGNRENLHQLYLFIKNGVNGTQLHGRKNS